MNSGCLICGSKRASSKGYLVDKQLLRCRDCGFFYHFPLSATEQENQRYRQMRFNLEFEKKIFTAKRPLFEAILNRLAYFPGVGRLLDVGCGLGFFLFLARLRGWDVQGLDLSGYAAEYARKNLNIPVANSTLGEADLSTASFTPLDKAAGGMKLSAAQTVREGNSLTGFTVITFWDSLDLMAEPRATLKQAYSLLQPGGTIYIRVRNGLVHYGLGQFFGWLTGENPGRIVTIHRSGFTPKTIKRLLKETGYQSIQILNSALTSGGEERFPQLQRIIRLFYNCLIKLISLASQGKWLISTSLEAWAEKPTDAAALPRKNQRILNLITRMDRGGSAENVYYTVYLLKQKGYTVSLASGPGESGNELAERLREKGIPVIILPHLRRDLSPLKDILAFFEILCLLRRGGFNLIHTHSSKAGFLGRWAAHLSGVPRIIHTPHGHIFYGYSSPLTSVLSWFMEKLTFPVTDFLVVLTDQGIREYLGYRIGVKERMMVIHSGVHLEYFSRNLGREETREELGIDSDTVMIGSIGRFEPVKGMADFLVAVRRLSQDSSLSNIKMCFLLVGEGSEGISLHRLVADWGLEKKVIFTGMREDVPRYLAATDIFVLASRNEGMGKVLVQAQAGGKAVVATRVGGISSVVKDGETGLLVPSANPESLYRALRYLLLNPAESERLGKNGRAWVQETVDGYPRFSVERMIFLLEKLYAQ